jgi:hypothetical protein
MIHISFPVGFLVRFDVLTAVSIRIWSSKDVMMYGCSVSTFQSNLLPLVSYLEDGGNTVKQCSTFRVTIIVVVFSIY